MYYVVGNNLTLFICAIRVMSETELLSAGRRSALFLGRPDANDRQSKYLRWTLFWAVVTLERSPNE